MLTIASETAGSPFASAHREIRNYDNTRVRFVEMPQILTLYQWNLRLEDLKSMIE